MRRIDYGVARRLLEASAKDTSTLSFEHGLVLRAEALWGGLTLEPGSQLEFASRPSRSLLQVRDDLCAYLGWLRAFAESENLVFLAVGFDPITTDYSRSWYLKDRYRILRDYLAGAGGDGLDMMCQTASIQTSLDYESFDDLWVKFLVGNRLSPVVAAIFANSPFRHAKLSGFKSWRYATWLKTDRGRCGVSPLAAEGSDVLTLDRFLDYVGRLPMILAVERNGYVPVTAPVSDRISWADQSDSLVLDNFKVALSTIFTDCRIKNVVELRAADSGDAEHALAVAALWKGLFYSKSALADALRLAPKLTPEAFYELQMEVARCGLQASSQGLRVHDLARQVMELAHAGLRAIAPQEAPLLEPAMDRVARGLCPADLLIGKFEREWHHDVGKAFGALRIA